MLISPVAYALAARSTAVEPSLGYALAAAGRLLDKQLNKMALYKDLLHHVDKTIRNRWIISAENEFGRLFQGFLPNGANAKGLDVLSWIDSSNIPLDKRMTYPRFVVNYCPEKTSEPYWTRITCGGDKLDYFGDVTTHTASMETIKLHWNSVLSTPGEIYCTGDISNMYLMSTLPEEEYVCFCVDTIPSCIYKHYNLSQFKHNGYVMLKLIKPGMALNKQEKLLTMILSSILLNMDTFALVLLMDYSNTRRVTYLLSLSLMILV